MDVLLEGLKVAAIGLGVTFVMLTLIVLFVKILPYLLKAAYAIGRAVKGIFIKKDKKPPVVQAIAYEAAQTNTANDGDIAAIVAAICCMSGLSNTQFRLVNVKRSNNASAWRSGN